MTLVVRIVTTETGLATRYSTALAPITCQHATEWPQASDSATPTVVLFDPATVDPQVDSAEPHHRAIEITSDFDNTARRVERAVAGRRFEAAIDARFDALASGAATLPAVEVPETLGVSALGELYGAI